MPAAFRHRGLLTSQIALALTVVAMGGVVGGIAWLFAGLWGLAAAGVAAAGCWLGAAVALEAATLLARQGHGLTGLLVGMGLRMGVPLALALVLFLLGGPLVQGGLMYYFVAFYPLTLAVETALSLWVRPSSCRTPVPTGQQGNCRPNAKQLGSAAQKGPF
jgi:hypothetical protein